MILVTYIKIQYSKRNKDDMMWGFIKLLCHINLKIWSLLYRLRTQKSNGKSDKTEEDVDSGRPLKVDR